MDTDSTLDIAMRAYWDADPTDISLNEICKRAGVSKPSVYRAFGNEDGLMRAVLDRYAERVLSDIFAIIAEGASLSDTLEQLATFASTDPKMETGCVFYKMRAGKHRLGPKTLARVEEIDTAATAAFAGFLDAQQRAGNWTGTQPSHMAARYLTEQIGLAFAQRAAGESPEQVRETLNLALSVFEPSKR